jgi:hypothetical protein
VGKVERRRSLEEGGWKEEWVMGNLEAEVGLGARVGD